MSKSFKVSLIAGFLMISAAAVTKALTPTHKIAEQRAAFDLGKMIPSKFGDWQVDTSIIPLQIDPETQAKLNAIYNQTLSRTYVNHDGERIMLSIAYGGDQSDGMQVHWPELCYTAQGFSVTKSVDTTMNSAYGRFPIRQLNAVAGARYEPITYWLIVGEHASTPGLDLKLAYLRYGLSGIIPDGMLIRVSNISREPGVAYALQQRFVKDMLVALTPESRKRLIGNTHTTGT